MILVWKWLCRFRIGGFGKGSTVEMLLQLRYLVLVFGSGGCD